MNWAVTISASTTQRRRSPAASAVGETVSCRHLLRLQIVDERNDSTTSTLARYTCADMNRAADRRRRARAASSSIAEELADSSGYLLARLGLAFKAQATARAEEAGFELYDYSVLAILGEGARETQATIADALDARPEPAGRAARLTRGARAWSCASATRRTAAATSSASPTPARSELAALRAIVQSARGRVLRAARRGEPRGAAPDAGGARRRRTTRAAARSTTTGYCHRRRRGAARRGAHLRLAPT